MSKTVALNPAAWRERPPPAAAAKPPAPGRPPRIALPEADAVFSSCIAAGVAFLVGIGNLLASVEAAVGAKARELLAADTELSSHRPFDAKVEAALARLESEGVRMTETVSFASMLTPKGKEPFLVMVKAVEEKYPFYGTMETTPQGVRPNEFGALLDQSAALERGITTGNTIQLGNSELKVLRAPDKGARIKLSPASTWPRACSFQRKLSSLRD